MTQNSTAGAGNGGSQSFSNGASQSQSMVDAVMAETIGMSMHNAVSSQQRAQMLSSAAVTAACARIVAATAKEAPLPVVTTLPAPSSSNTPASDIAQSNMDAQAAITALSRQADSSTKDASTARGDLKSLSDMADQGAGDQ